MEWRKNTKRWASLQPSLLSQICWRHIQLIEGNWIVRWKAKTNQLSLTKWGTRSVCDAKTRQLPYKQNEFKSYKCQRHANVASVCFAERMAAFSILDLAITGFTMLWIIICDRCCLDLLSELGDLHRSESLWLPSGLSLEFWFEELRFGDLSCFWWGSALPGSKREENWDGY